MRQTRSRQLHNPTAGGSTSARLRRHAMARAIARVLGGAVMASAAIGWMAAAHAQAAEAARDYAVPAGPLAPALSAFMQASGATLVFSAEQVQARQSAGVQGRLDVESALRQLLAGTGLHAVRAADGRYLVGTEPPRTAQAALPAVTVSANQLGEITEGSGSYRAGTVATATRLPLTLRETPQSISVVTRQKMDDFNLRTIDDVMAHTPGISIVTYDSERTEYYARGFAIQNFQYDGIPMRRDSSYSAGNTLTDMVIYDRVEVLKGSTGLLTGSGEPGATINLVRKKPTRTFQGHVTASAGSWDTYRGEVDLSGSVNASGSVRARGVLAYQDRHSQLDGYARKTPVFYGIVEADLSANTLLTLGTDYQHSQPTRSTWGGIPLLDANGNFNDRPRSFNNGANWSRWNQYTRTQFATLEQSFANGWIGKLQLNHQINGYDANLGASAAGFPNPADGSGVGIWAGQYIGRTTSNAGDVFFSGPVTLAGREHELVLGGSLAKRRWKNAGWYTAPGFNYDVADYYAWNGDIPAPQWGAAPDYTDNETTRESGAYAAMRWNLRDDLKLITGVRWANYKNAVQNLHESGVIVPYLGAIYDLDKTYSLYASYTSIFSPQSKRTEGGSVLKPVEGNNIEAGLKADLLDGKLTASAAVFELVQDNYGIETGGFTPTGAPAFRAVDGVKTRGFEIEATGEIARGWQVQAGFVHAVSRQQGDRVATLTPSNQFKLHTSYKLGGALKGLTVGGGVRWDDKTWGDISTPTAGVTERHTVKGYWLADLMARYEFDEHLSASVSIKNLFDKKYYTIFNWYSTYTWGEPRNVTASVTYKF